MNEIRELRLITGLTQTKFGELYDIPMRTIQNWELGVTTPPPYVVNLLRRAVKEDIHLLEEQKREKKDSEG